MQYDIRHAPGWGDGREGLVESGTTDEDGLDDLRRRVASLIQMPGQGWCGPIEVLMLDGEPDPDPLTDRLAFCARCNMIHGLDDLWGLLDGQVHDCPESLGHRAEWVCEECLPDEDENEG